MEKMKKWLEPTKNKVIAGVIAVLLVSGIGFGIWSLTKTEQFEFEDLTYDKLSIILVEDKEAMNGDMDTVINGRMKAAYPDDFDKITILSYEYDVTKVSDVKEVYGQFDNKEEIYEAISEKAKAQEVKPFTGSLTYRVDNEDKKLNFEYIVVDTGLPIIEGDDEVTLEHDETFDVTKYKASDPVDGEIAISVAEGSGEVVDGKTTMILVATDKNGNETRKEVKVTIKKAPVEEEPVEEAPTNGGNNNATANTGGSSSSNNGNSNTSTGSGGSSNNGGGSTSETPTPPSPEKPGEPNYLCPNGKDKNRPCTDWIDPYAYMAYSHYESMGACQSSGKTIYDSLKKEEIDGKEITNWGCTELNMNDASYGSFYRFELMHNGQWWLNSNKQWVQ